MTAPHDCRSIATLSRTNESLNEESKKPCSASKSSSKKQKEYSTSRVSQSLSRLALTMSHNSRLRIVICPHSFLKRHQKRSLETSRHFCCLAWPRTPDNNRGNATVIFQHLHAVLRAPSSWLKSFTGGKPPDHPDQALERRNAQKEVVKKVPLISLSQSLNCVVFMGARSYEIVAS